MSLLPLLCFKIVRQSNISPSTEVGIMFTQRHEDKRFGDHRTATRKPPQNKDDLNWKRTTHIPLFFVFLVLPKPPRLSCADPDGVTRGDGTARGGIRGGNTAVVEPRRGEVTFSRCRRSGRTFASSPVFIHLRCSAQRSFLYSFELRSRGY